MAEDVIAERVANAAFVVLTEARDVASKQFPSLELAQLRLYA
jgi:hypothetical protein